MVQARHSETRISCIRRRGLAATVLAGALASSLVPVAQACTRAVYLGSDATVITGRSMDWMEDMRTNLWAFPAGMARDRAAGANTRNGCQSTAASSLPAMTWEPPMA